jgi:eukaryotic-like serine/threonine-protein kinase
MSTGRTIADRYRLGRPLGGGGMGEVWEAWDIRLDRAVAVKLVRPAALVPGTDPQVLATRFGREARMTARLNHRGVPAVYDTGADGGDMFLVMELVEGADLADFQAENAPVPAHWIAAAGAQLAAVLGAAHAAMLVHRDLKPRNVMITPSGEVKILDFGIAAVRDTDITRLTRTSESLGTPAYMAPEQAMHGQTSPSSDLYSLGCVLYELATGDRVFDAPTPLALMQRHYADTPVPVREVRRDLPAELAQLIDRLLAKRPGDRPADAREVFDRLVPLIQGPSKGLPMDPTRPFRDPLAAPSRPAATAGEPQVKTAAPPVPPKINPTRVYPPAKVVERPPVPVKIGKDDIGDTFIRRLVESALMVTGMTLPVLSIVSASAQVDRQDPGVTLVFALAFFYLGGVLRQRRLGLRRVWTVNNDLRWTKPPRPASRPEKLLERVLLVLAALMLLISAMSIPQHDDSAARAFVVTMALLVPGAVMWQRRTGRLYPWSIRRSRR